MQWRHLHIAHRIDRQTEQVSVHHLWAGSGEKQPTFRVRIVTSIGPEDQVAERLAPHCEQLATLVWEKRMWPIKNAYYSNLPAEKLKILRQHHAKPFTPPPQPQDSIGVTLNLGIEVP